MSNIYYAQVVRILRKLSANHIIILNKTYKIRPCSGQMYLQSDQNVQEIYNKNLAKSQPKHPI